MAFFEYSSTILLSLLIFISFLVVLYRQRQNKNFILPTNWPVLGMLPVALLYVNRPHDYITDVLTHSGGTYLYKSPWFTNMDMLFTINPMDIHHIMSKNFPNYPKGLKLRKMFDILGDGIIGSDGPLWEFERRTYMSLFKAPSFENLLEKTIWNKVDEALLPVLDDISEKKLETDLQDIFQRLAFDTGCALFLDYDPKSMSLDLPYIPSEKALSGIAEALFQRAVVPPTLLGLLQLLGLGMEKKLANAWKDIDGFIYKIIDQKQKEFNELQDDQKFIFPRALVREFKDEKGTSGDSKKFLRDNFFNLIIGGRDTTGTVLTWLFYLLSKNPIVEDKIREEIHSKLNMESRAKWKHFNTKELSQLVYLHGALCETLRLFPPIPFEFKTPLQPDILPSGDQVDHNTAIVLCFHTMGRMKSIWGDDCMEFKPERWISENGGIIHQPSYKFPAFNAGPRTCLGKDMSFTNMKIVATTIIHHYNVELVKGHHVSPSASIILTMKRGLKVRLTKRS